MLEVVQEIPTLGQFSFQFITFARGAESEGTAGLEPLGLLPELPPVQHSLLFTCHRPLHYTVKERKSNLSVLWG